MDESTYLSQMGPLSFIDASNPFLLLVQPSSFPRTYCNHGLQEVGFMFFSTSLLWLRSGNFTIHYAKLNTRTRLLDSHWTGELQSTDRTLIPETFV